MGHADEKPTLDDLVQDHLPETFRFAVRLTGNSQSAEELVQEALVRVARSWHKFRGEAQFKTWLFRIVINAFRDRLAKTTPSQAIVGDPIDTRGTDPAAAAQAEELGELIAVKVSALPPRQREVLVLVAYESLTPREVSELLQITEANVHATLYAAREKLRRELAPYLVEK